MEEKPRLCACACVCVWALMTQGPVGRPCSRPGKRQLRREVGARVGGDEKEEKQRGRESSPTSPPTGSPTLPRRPEGRTSSQRDPEQSCCGWWEVPPSAGQTSGRLLREGLQEKRQHDHRDQRFLQTPRSCNI